MKYNLLEMENEDLRKELDHLIHSFWSAHTRVKESERCGDGEASDLIDGFFFSILKELPAICQRHRIYPYNQKQVRMEESWKCCPPGCIANPN